MKDMVKRNVMIGKEQNGFRRDRRGEDNLYVMIEVIERLKKKISKDTLHAWILKKLMTVWIRKC